MIKFLKKALLEFVLLETVPIIAIILLGIFFSAYFPEHWGKLMLLSIMFVFYFFIKLFTRLDK
ncbi:hypothetical protein LQ939_03985 [Pantoea alhagi]|uniref:hypothetical protein n=1 Tax=Pantoea alhagi TaxID=1891675 RepID=UPI00202B2D83|nr:hypothetical protein [Pantoea alhagi]URQ61504.1 hypothetical protein LQ939_03985 [Pantoea alhagi]